MAEMIQEEQPKVETERKLGNTTYIVSGYFASNGVTVSDRIRTLLDRDITEEKS